MQEIIQSILDHMGNGTHLCKIHFIAGICETHFNTASCKTVSLKDQVP